MRLAATILLLMAMALPAAAETCREKFVRLFTDRKQEPVKIHVTQEMKGGMTTKNFNYQNGRGDWMTEMIEPKTLPWTLVSNNVMYTSADQGKTWVKVRTLDSAQDPEAAKASLREAAATAKNVACGTDQLNGIPHETVEADYVYPKYKTQHHDKFWVNTKTGRIGKSTTWTKQGAFESTVIQIIEPAPDLKLPTPK